MLLAASKHPVQQLEPEEVTEMRKNENRARCNANVIHQADKILRKKVSENLKSIEGSRKTLDVSMCGGELSGFL